MYIFLLHMGYAKRRILQKYLCQDFLKPRTILVSVSTTVLQELDLQVNNV